MINFPDDELNGMMQVKTKKDIPNLKFARDRSNIELNGLSELPSARG